MLQQNKGWEKNVMYTCKDNLIPLLYGGKIKLKKKSVNTNPFQTVPKLDKEKRFTFWCSDSSITLIITLGKALKGKQNQKTKHQYSS